MKGTDSSFPAKQVSALKDEPLLELPDLPIRDQCAVCCKATNPNSFCCCVLGTEDWNKHRTNFSAKYLLLEKAYSRDPTSGASDRPDFV